MENFKNKIEYALIITASLLPFRKIGAIAIFLFTIYCLALNKIRFNKKNLIPTIVIASPFLIHLLFLFNEPDIFSATKVLEKNLSFIIFPLVILNIEKKINFSKILNGYAKGSTFIFFSMLVGFIAFEPEKVNKYLNGIDLWESGYEYARFFGSHGPATNMHLAFISSINFYFLIQKGKQKWLNLLTFIISLGLLFIVNTRLSILLTFICIVLTIFYKLSKVSVKKLFVTISTVTLITGTMFYATLKLNPYFKEKIGKITFAHMDKIGRLDEVENPEVEIFNALVTRISIWKSSIELSSKNLLTGVGASNSKIELNEYYKNTNQKFLYKYKFPTHNQYLDYLLKFGITGLLISLIYMINILFIGIKSKNILAICFFIIFSVTNLFDDFLIRFDGIAFSAFWVSLFTLLHLKHQQDKSL